MSNFTPPPRVKNAFDISKLRLTAMTPGQDDPKQKSTIQLTLVKNMPRFLVWTNDPSEKGDQNKGYGKITANLDPVVLTTAWQILREVINHEGKIKLAVQNKGYKFFGKQRSDGPVVLNHLIFGKEDDGMIWMMVSEKGRPQIRFDFRMPDFHSILDESGQPIPIKMESKMVAEGWVNLMAVLMTVMIADNYEEPPPRDQNGGGNRGGYNGGGNNNGGGGGYNRGGGGGYNNNGGGNGGGYNAPAAGGIDNGEDIPF